MQGKASEFDDHQIQIDNYRRRLTNLKKDWRDNNCDDPDDPPFGTNEWITLTDAGHLRLLSKDYKQGLKDLRDLATGAATGAAAVSLLNAAMALFSEIASYFAELAALDPLFVP